MSSGSPVSFLGENCGRSGLCLHIEGRFVQTDPIGYDHQMNLYAYVANDPINQVDPGGEKAVAWAVRLVKGGVKRTKAFVDKNMQFKLVNAARIFKPHHARWPVRLSAVQRKIQTT